MLITNYLVGRDKQGKCLCLVVKDVLPVDCEPGRSSLVKKLARQDLVQEFVQDGVPVDWITFPDLPRDVCELLESGSSLTIIDEEDNVAMECSLESHAECSKVGVL